MKRYRRDPKRTSRIYPSCSRYACSYGAHKYGDDDRSRWVYGGYFYCEMNGITVQAKNFCQSGTRRTGTRQHRFRFFLWVSGEWVFFTKCCEFLRGSSDRIFFCSYGNYCCTHSPLLNPTHVSSSAGNARGRYYYGRYQSHQN